MTSTTSSPRRACTSSGRPPLRRMRLRYRPRSTTLVSARESGLMRAVVLGLIVVAASSAASAAEPFHLIPGRVPADKGPDGNTIVLDAPRGLIVFDTGRHPEHAQAILNYAKARHRPIAAIINSHWHLDHTTGNWDIRQAFPRVDIYASNALEGALATFLKQGRSQGDRMLADPKT